ncbi:MAG: radical SAM protein [Caldithrix sp.]|nr:radical SAM protein [Caldithrix sp.]
MDLKQTLRINEIFFSIQGESTYAGQPCIFIRLSYCNLRCNYCDTEYAFYEGTEHTLVDILNETAQFDAKLVEITGGEPLLQNNVLALMQELSNRGYNVLLETAGHRDISVVDERVIRIMDIKCPSSGESQKMYWKNLEYLTHKDQVKFVIGHRLDYDYAKDITKKYNLSAKVHAVLFSPVFGLLDNRVLSEWILQDQLPVRFQIQLHKYIWEPDRRGV